MCATVCPSGALHWGSAEEIAVLRRERPLREFAFGAERLRTKVALMGPAGLDALELDVEALAVPAGEAPPARRVA
ncbi:hypothetical protein D3C83_178090 [compost metagenome]